MFDFEKLGAYTKARDFNHSAISIVRRYDVDRITENQFRRASLSIMLNIAEASGRFTKPDKRRFFVIARGSSYECVALLDYMRAMGLIPEETYRKYYQDLEELSKVLFGLIRKLS